MQTLDSFFFQKVVVRFGLIFENEIDDSVSNLLQCDRIDFGEAGSNFAFEKWLILGYPHESEWLEWGCIDFDPALESLGKLLEVVLD